MTKIGTFTALQNLGPASTRWLNAIGVHTRRDLEKLGAVDAYRILRAHGYNATLNLVYAIEGALRDRDWKRLPAKRKAQLKAAAAVKPRCAWPANDPHMLRYHDEEWGVPVHDDRKHFEFLILEGAQAGLSWRTVLHKRAAYRAAFAGFDPRRVARFDARKVKTLLKNDGIIRSLGFIGDRRAPLLRTKVRQLTVMSGSSSAAADRQPLEDAAADPGAHARIGRTQCRSQETRVPFCRLDHRLRAHAGDRPGQRPPDALLSPPRAGAALTCLEDISKDSLASILVGFALRTIGSSNR